MKTEQKLGIWNWSSKPQNLIEFKFQETQSFHSIRIYFLIQKKKALK